MGDLIRAALFLLNCGVLDLEDEDILDAIQPLRDALEDLGYDPDNDTGRDA